MHVTNEIDNVSHETKQLKNSNRVSSFNILQ